MAEMIGFGQIRELLPVPAFDDETLGSETVTRSVEECPHRGEVSIVKETPVATCALIEETRGVAGAVSETICRRCRAAGASFDPAANEYLRHRLFKECYALAVSPPDGKERRMPTDREVEACVAGAKAVAGDALARRLVDTLYVLRSRVVVDGVETEVDAERCIDLIEKCGVRDEP